jgi:hypothetical protein
MTQITEEKDKIEFTIKSQAGSKEFVLRAHEGLFYLDVCAYGDLWSEKFNSVQEIKDYLEKEWNFIDHSFLNKLEK